MVGGGDNSESKVVHACRADCLSSICRLSSFACLALVSQAARPCSLRRTDISVASSRLA